MNPIARNGTSEREDPSRTKHPKTVMRAMIAAEKARADSAEAKLAIAVEAATKLLERFQEKMRGRTWSMTDMQAMAQMDAALSQIGGE